MPIEIRIIKDLVDGSKTDHFLSRYIESACSDPQPHPHNFYKLTEILAPEVLRLYVFMGCSMSEICSVGEISEKQSWK